MIMGKWVDFVPAIPNKKTKVWDVWPKDAHERIGIIKWFGRWRKYCFFPELNTVYEEDCLRDIAEFIERVTKEHRQKKKLKPLTKNCIGKGNSDYWKKAHETVKEVEGWPKWKRDTKIGQTNDGVEDK